VDGDVVRCGPGERVGAVEDFGEIAEFAGVTATGDIQGEGVIATVEGVVRGGEAECALSRFEGLDFEGAGGADDLEAAVGCAEGVAVITAESDDGFRVFQDGDLVVREGGGGVESGGPVECVYGCGLAEDEDHQVYEVAGQFEHAVAGVICQGVQGGGIGQFAHGGVDLGDLAQPSFAASAEEQLEGWVVAEHVAHLDRELTMFGLEAEPAEVGVRRGAGLIQVDVFTGLKTGEGGAGGIGERGFDHDGLDGSVGEQFSFREPGKAGIGRLLACEGQAVWQRFGDTDDFEEVREGAESLHFAGGV